MSSVLTAFRDRAYNAACAAALQHGRTAGGTVESGEIRGRPQTEKSRGQEGLKTHIPTI